MNLQSGAQEWCMHDCSKAEWFCKDTCMYVHADLTKLNENVMRERHIMPSVLNEANFSKLDAKFRILANPSLQTVYPVDNVHHTLGRYCFNHMPFGIAPAPEHFQCRMSEILQGLDGVSSLPYG